jgi:hypothetical protein
VKLLLWVLALVADTPQRDAICGDLAEESRAIAARIGHAAAHRWRRRQLIATCAHLIVGQLRAAPWSTLMAVGAGLVGITALSRAIVAAEFAIVRMWDVYNWIDAVTLWRTGDVLVTVTPPLAAGWLAGRLSRGREIASAAALAGALAAIGVWDWIVVFARAPIHWPVRIWSLSIRVSQIELMSALLLLPTLWPILVLAGGAIARLMRTSRAPRLA